MNWKFMAVLAIALAVIAALAQQKSKPASKKASEPPKKKPPLTEREQSMYFRLTQTFPELIVLAQVAMSAVLDSKEKGVRNTFDRKVIDFVLCSKAFEVMAVIELDDSSHRGKEAKDANRDAMLKAAGYRVMRFPEIPDRETLKKALAAPNTTAGDRTPQRADPTW